MEPLIEIVFDGGSRYYSRHGLRLATIPFFEPLLASFGGVTREIGLVPGDFRASSLSVTFSNTTGEFSKLRETEKWRNRIVKLYLIDPDEGLSSFQVAFTGRINSWAVNRTQCTIDAVDALQSRLHRPLRPVLTPGFFHRLGETTTPHALIPQVIGAVSAPLGAVPAYLVEPSVEITPYRYVAALGEIKSIDAVYAYGSLVDPGDYTVSSIPGPSGELITVIDFDSDQKVSGDPTEPHVAWNGVGYTDDGTSSGNAITNPANQFAQALELNGFSSSELDATALAAAANTFTVDQVTGGVCFTDRALTVGELARQFAESFNLQIFWTSGGKIGLFAPSPSVDPEAVLPELTALEDVVRGSFTARGPDQIAATVVGDFSYNWYTNEFQDQREVVNVQQIGALNEDVQLASLHPFIRSGSALTAVVSKKAFFLREQRQLVEVTVPPTYHQTLDIGDFVRLTHFAGPLSGGYSRKIFLVIASGIRAVGPSLATFLRLVDVEPEPPYGVPLATLARPGLTSDYYLSRGVGSSIPLGRLRIGS